MPDLDLTDITLDTFIAGETFQVIRRAEVISWHGRSIAPGVPFSVIGQVTPSGDNSLVRQRDFDAMNKTIMVITAFPLRGVSNDGAVNYKPDLVAWHGDYYVVRYVRDYGNYGAGLFEAECSSYDLEDLPPIAANL